MHIDRIWSLSESQVQLGETLAIRQSSAKLICSPWQQHSLAWVIFVKKLYYNNHLAARSYTKSLTHFSPLCSKADITGALPSQGTETDINTVHPSLPPTISKAMWISSINRSMNLSAVDPQFLLSRLGNHRKGSLHQDIVLGLPRTVNRPILLTPFSQVYMDAIMMKRNAEILWKHGGFSHYVFLLIIRLFITISYLWSSFRCTDIMIRESPEFLIYPVFPSPFLFLHCVGTLWSTKVCSIHYALGLNFWVQWVLTIA